MVRLRIPKELSDALRHFGRSLLVGMVQTAFLSISLGNEFAHSRILESKQMDLPGVQFLISRET